MGKRDYYEILGINKTATSEEIKKAYRKRSMETHPDRGGDENQFKEVAEAYEILSDPAKKQNYDTYGHNAPRGQNWGGEDPFDMFKNMFTNFSFGGQQGQRQRKGNDLQLTVKLTLEEIFNGISKTFKYKRKTPCNECSGGGGTGKKTCPTCNGAGMIAQVINTPFGQIRNAAECHSCEGQGYVYEKICNSCVGQGVKDFEETVEVQIPHGVVSNMRMALSGKGNAIKNGIPGDLIVTLIEEPHQKFVRFENDLKLTIKLTYPQLVLGDSVEIPTIEGGKIRVKIQAFTKVNDILRVQGKGMKPMNSFNRGDMLVNVDLLMPSTITDEEKELIINLKNLNEKVAT